MESKNAAVILIYSSLFGLIGTFFSFILTPIQMSASFDSSYNLKTSEATLISLCFDGTIKAGAFVFVMLILVLLLALVVDIIITIRLSRQEDFPKPTYILTIIYGGVTLILAIVFVAVFFDTFNGQYVSSSSSSKGTTVTTGADLWYAYLFLFEAAVTAIIAGIIGLKGDTPSYSYKKVKVPKVYGYSYSKPSVVSTFRFNTGDVVRLTSDNFVPEVAKGTECVVTRVVSDEVVYVKKNGSSEAQEFSIFTYKLALVATKLAEETPVAKVTEPRPASINQPKTNSVSNESENIKRIKEYKELLDEGIITQEEFDKKKKELLNL